MLYYSWSVICIVLLICSFVSGFRAFTVRSKARTCQYFPLHINRALDMNTDAPVTPTSKLASQMLLGTESGNKYYPMGTTYCQCSLCKTAYLVDVEILGSKGLKLMCNVCKKDWFQTSERLLTTDDMHFLMPMPAIKVDEVKKILAEKNIPKYPRVDKIGIFVGNLPYKYTEEDITNLFAEYGLTDITLVRDAEQQSKGFAFIECSNIDDAERLCKEMNGFYTEPNRRLTVNLTKAKGEGAKGGYPRMEQRREYSVPASSGKSWSRATGFQASAATNDDGLKHSDTL